MPDNIQHWSTCEPLSESDAGFFNKYLVPDFGGPLFDLAFVSLVYGIATMVLPAAAFVQFVEQILKKSADGGCFWGALWLGVVIYTLIAASEWFDHNRTVCRDSAACAVGTIVHDPHNNDNGDLDLDLALAPFDPGEQLDAVRDSLQSNMGIPSTSEVDAYISLASLSPADRLSVYEHAVDEGYLNSPSDRLFQQRYFTIGMDLEPFVQTSEIKPPLYRCPSDEKDESEKIPIPLQINEKVLQNMHIYLPSVIEGHVYVEWLKNLRNAAIAGTVGFIAGCAICIYFTGDAQNCAWVGMALGIVLAFLTWLISHLLNNPGDTKADGGNPASQVGDSTSPPAANSSAERGDIVVVFGSWVVFKYSNQYYEIHPVTAWYLICRQGKTSDFVPKGMGVGRCSTSRMTAEEYDSICRMVHAAETEQPSSTLKIHHSSGLSMAGGLH